MATRNVVGAFAVFRSVSVGAVPSTAQVLLSGDQLNQLASRVALYPDGLLAQALAASTTYSDETPEAAQWSDGYSYLHGDALSAAISDDNLPCDPSILSLLPFASVLDAVQRERETARKFDYLQDCPEYRVVVAGPGIIEILPTDPASYYVPIYGPLVVFYVEAGRGRGGDHVRPRVVVGTGAERHGNPSNGRY